MTPVGPEAFRDVMGRLPTGVALVSAREPSGRIVGMTAGTVTSLSLAPPMLLVCVGRDATLHEAIVRAEHFGVNVLARDQQDLAERFALREHRWWDDVPALSPAGLPLAPGALAHLDCRRAAVYNGGDHSIVTGTVEWARTAEGPPLSYFRGAYTGLLP